MKIEKTKTESISVTTKIQNIFANSNAFSKTIKLLPDTERDFLYISGNNLLKCQSTSGIILFS